MLNASLNVECCRASGGVQARRAWSYLPEIHLRRVRRTPQESRSFDQGSNKVHIDKPLDRYATLEDRDEYTAANIFWVPQEARWAFLQGKAKQPTIGKLIDEAMVAIEPDNPSPKSVLPKDYARPALDKQQLGELIDLIAKIGLGDKANRSQDVLGRVYEYFLGQFASAEGKKGGPFYTARAASFWVSDS